MSLIKLSAVEEKEMVPGFWGRFVHTDNVTLVYWRVESGAALPEHAHRHEQITNLITGDFELTVAGQVIKMGKGEVVTIAPHVSHAGKAISDCYLIDVFYPAREDYR
ncbi:MAG: cupin domain-containing protein [Smithellaceae bacterium]|nr:cupin domain-containing protein [Smithellaceae bacterium]